MNLNPNDVRVLHVRAVIRDREYELAKVRRRLKKGKALPAKLKRLAARAELLPEVIRRFRTELLRLEPQGAAERMPSLDIHGAGR